MHEDYTQEQVDAMNAAEEIMGIIDSEMNHAILAYGQEFMREVCSSTDENYQFHMLAVGNAVTFLHRLPFNNPTWKKILGGLMQNLVILTLISTRGDPSMAFRNLMGAYTEAQNTLKGGYTGKVEWHAQNLVARLAARDENIIGWQAKPPFFHMILMCESVGIYLRDLHKLCVSDGASSTPER